MTVQRIWQLVALGALSAALVLGYGSYKLFGRWKDEHANMRLFAALGSDPAREVPRQDAHKWPEGTYRVVFAGDSRVADWPLPDAPEGMTILNRGLGGETSRQFRARLPELITSLDPDLLVLSMGVNDLYAGVLRPEWLLNIRSELSDNIQYISEYTLDHGTDLILLSILQPALPEPFLARFAWSEHIYDEVARMNVELAAMASPPRLTVFDMNAILGSASEGPLDEAHAQDAMHPNTTAYATLAKALIQEISRR